MNNERLLALSEIDDVAARVSCCLSAFEIIRFAVDGPGDVTHQFLDAITSILFQLGELNEELLGAVNHAYAIEGFMRKGGGSVSYGNS